jgi:hypothetical protein
MAWRLALPQGIVKGRSCNVRPSGVAVNLLNHARIVEAGEVPSCVCIRSWIGFFEGPER